MANDDFYIINSWMIEELGLSGVELQCFAIIWSLSRGEKQMYIAGNSHLIKMTKKTEPTIINALKSLREKGLIKRFPTVVNNIERMYYKAITKGLNNFSGDEEKDDNEGLKNLSGGLKNLSGTTKKILAPNIESKKESNNKEEKLSNDNSKEGLDFDSFYKLYPLKRSRNTAEKVWGRLSVKDKKEAIKKLPAYISDCYTQKRKFQYPATYLNQKTWEDDFGNIQNNISCYEPLPEDDDKVVRFKKWMRENHTEIENTEKPLTFEGYMRLQKEYGMDEVCNQLDYIDANIGRFRKSDIEASIKYYFEHQQYD